MARNLGIRVGDRVLLVSMRQIQEAHEARKNENAPAIVQDDYQVAGIFDVGQYEYNSSFVVTSLVTAQELYGYGEAVEGLFVTIRNAYGADDVRKELSRAIRGDVYISTWLEDHFMFLDALLVDKKVLLLFLFFIMLVVSLVIM